MWAQAARPITGIGGSPRITPRWLVQEGDRTVWALVGQDSVLMCDLVWMTLCRNSEQYRRGAGNSSCCAESALGTIYVPRDCCWSIERGHQPLCASCQGRRNGRADLGETATALDRVQGSWRKPRRASSRWRPDLVNTVLTARRRPPCCGLQAKGRRTARRAGILEPAPATGWKRWLSL